MFIVENTCNTTECHDPHLPPPFSNNQLVADYLFWFCFAFGDLL